MTSDCSPRLLPPTAGNWNTPAPRILHPPCSAIRIRRASASNSRYVISLEPTALNFGSYEGGENALADQLEESFSPGMLNLADRGFFSMDRFLRFSARGAHLAWRVKNAAKSVPLRVIRTLHRPRPDPLHRRLRPRPRPHRSRHSLQALRTPSRQSKRPTRQPERRDPRPPQTQARTPADIRKDRSRTPDPSHRGSHLHHRDHEVESPEMGHSSGNLRAVALNLSEAHIPAGSLKRSALRRGPVSG